MSFRRILSILLISLLIPAGFAFAQTDTPTPTATPDRRGLVPVGTIMLYGNEAAPNDAWLVCDGHAIYRSEYPDLFNVIGTTFGPGDGTTTFNLPDFRGRVPSGSGAGLGLTYRTVGDYFGEETHTLSITEMPSHSIPSVWLNGGTNRAVVSSGGAQLVHLGDSTPVGGGAAFNISQPSLVVGYYIFAGEDLSFSAPESIEVTVVIVFPSHTPTSTETPTLTPTTGPSPTPSPTATATAQIETVYQVGGQDVVVRNEVTPGDAAIVGFLVVILGLQISALFLRRRR